MYIWSNWFFRFKILDHIFIIKHIGRIECSVCIGIPIYYVYQYLYNNQKLKKYIFKRKNEFESDSIGLLLNLHEYFTARFFFFSVNGNRKKYDLYLADYKHLNNLIPYNFIGTRYFMFVLSEPNLIFSSFTCFVRPCNINSPCSDSVYLHYL